MKGFFGLLLLIIAPVQAETIRVAAAADLRFVMPELVEQYQQTTSDKIAVTYGSSGKIASQIKYGAPYDIFFSAHARYTNILSEQQLIRGRALHYANGYLALFARNQSSLAIDTAFAGLRQALAKQQVNKFAIANPEHAPYGQLAKQQLEQADLWYMLQPHLLLAENAAQVMQFTLTGNVDGGVVPYAMAVQPEIARQGRAIKLPEALHQYVVVLKTAPPTAENFLTFIRSAAAKKTFNRHGFGVEDLN